MRYKHLILTVIALMFAACYGDKGNYDYTEINDLEISGFADGGYEKIAFVDDLVITPQIASRYYGENIDNFEFEWKLMHQAANEATDGVKDYTIGNEKNLSIPVTQDAGNYNGYLIVTDKTNGLEWRKHFTVKVKSLTSEGWLVLCDVGGEARLDIVFNENADSDIVAYDLWEVSENKTHNPEKILFSYILGGSKTIYVCDEGSYILSDNLSVEESGDIRWSFGASPEHLYIQGSAASQFANVRKNWIVIDQSGDAYILNLSEYGSVFGFPANYVGGTEYFRAAPFVGTTYAWYYGASMLMYDQTNGRFLEVIDGANYPSVMTFMGTQLFTAEQPGYEMVHLESTKNGYNYAILQDPISGRYYFYCIEMNEAGKNNQIYHGEVKGEGLDRVKQFACHHMNTQPYLFYSTDDTIYQFDMSHPNDPAKVAVSFTGETVQVIKFTPYVAWEAYTTWERERNYRLVVGSNVNGGDHQSCGIMRTYNVPVLMGDLTLAKEHKGLGRIVDITYKERGK